MTPSRTRSRHGLNAIKAQVKLRGLAAIDMRTVAAREMVGFRDELVAALGGDLELSPQRRKLVDLAARATLYLDHIDAWLAAQSSLINQRSRSVLPVLVQRQGLADHLARLLDKLGLDRVPRRVKSLGEYLAEKYTDSPANSVAAAMATSHDASGDVRVGTVAGGDETASSVGADVTVADAHGSGRQNRAGSHTEPQRETDNLGNCTRCSDIGMGDGDVGTDTPGRSQTDFDGAASPAHAANGYEDVPLPPTGARQ